MIVNLDSVWLRHPRIWWTLSVLMLLATVSMWLFNREVPTSVMAQYVVPSVEQGKDVPVRVPVIRHLERRCSVTYTRNLLTSEHALKHLDNGHVGSEGLEIREKATPGKLVLDVPVPAAPLGESSIITDNQYRCMWNPSTWLYPIEDTWEFKFVIVKAMP